MIGELFLIIVGLGVVVFVMTCGINWALTHITIKDDSKGCCKGKKED